MASLGYRVCKRSTDVVGAALGLALASPLFLAVAVAIKCDDGGSVFFRQERVGRQGRRFQLWKFRSMREGADRAGPSITVEGDPRITAVGRVLRKTKIDELPQLWNVLLGEMSLVGPRPESLKYSEEWKRIDPQIISFKPGLTSMASLLYCDEARILSEYTEPERAYVKEILPAKVALDVEHFKEASYVKDLQILFSTLKRLWVPISRI